MYKFLTILSFYIIAATLYGYAQERYTISTSDSITYQYYMNGDWENVIRSGNESIQQQVDFKWLRQRMGYAYYMKGDYYKALQQYEKALAFDTSDTVTLTYLYYCGLFSNNEAFARYQAGKLPADLQEKLKVKPIRIIDALDAEYNYKFNTLSTRSNPGYYRIGINSQLGYRVNLYQAFSNYTQRIDSAAINQNEYFALADWSVNAHMSLSLGYHYLGTNIADTIRYRVNRRMISTRIDSTFYPGNLFYSRLSIRLNRLDLSLSGSVLDYDNTLTQQYGIQAGYALPGKLKVYVRSSLFGLLSPVNKRLIFSQSIGAYFFNSLWAEGNITLGNLKNYAENNGLYVYNSDDATTFRTGLSLYWNVTRNVILFGNYSYNRKQTGNTSIYYNQHSISTGIIWKI